MARYLSCSCEAFKDVKFWPIELIGFEAYSSPGEFKILTLADADDLDINKWLGRQFAFSINAQGQSPRDFFAYITQVQAIESNLYGYGYYLFTLSSWTELMAHSQHNRTFYQQDLKGILQTVLSPYNADASSGKLICTPAFDMAPTCMVEPFALPDGVTMPEYVVQYNETDAAFVQRLLSSLGVCYWIDWNCTDNSMYLSGGANQEYTKVTNGFIWPDGKVRSDQQSLLSAKINYKVVSHQIRSANYDYNNAADINTEKLAVLNSTPKSPHKDREIYHYPNTQPTSTQGQQQQHARVELQLRSMVVSVSLGQSIDLSGALPAIVAKNPKIIPTEVVHYVKDYDGLPHADCEIDFHILPDDWTLSRTHYENKITAVLDDGAPYCPVIENLDHKMFGYQLGFVVGPDEGEVYTDQLGRVKVWFPWDENNPKASVKQCPWVRVKQQQAKKDIGQQFLPRVGDEVTIMYVDGRPNKPVVMGSNYNAKTLPPFKVLQDSSVTGFKTDKHSLFFTDQKDQEYMVLHSAGDLQQIVGGDLVRNVGGMDNLLVSGDALEEVLTGKYSLQANKSITLQCGSSVVLITPDEIKITGPEVDFVTQGGGPTANVAVIGSDHSCPKIENLQRHVGGPILQGSANVSIGGKPVARVGDQAKCHVGKDTLKEGHTNLLVNDKQVVCVKHKTKHGGKVTKGVSGVSAGYDASLIPKAAMHADRHAIQVSFTMDALPKVAVLYHQFSLTRTGAEAFSSNFVIDSTNPKTVAEGVTGGKADISLMPYQRQMDIIAVDNGSGPTYQLPYYKAKLNVPAAPIVDNNFDSAHQFDCKVLWPMVIHDIRVEDQVIGRTDADVDADLAAGKITAAAASQEKEDIAKERQAEAKDQAKKAAGEEIRDYYKISEQDIEYFKANGNNVTVFVHGYNVELGEFAHELSGFDVEEKDIASLEAPMPAQKIISPKFSSHYSTVYRDADVIKEQTNFSLPSDYVAKDSDGLQYINVSGVNSKRVYINGTGSRNWAINMEYNVNYATGKFKPESNVKDYQKYTRMIHVTWSGDPDSALDYMTAVDSAFIAATELAELLLRLKGRGLQVNIIAHSLGNAVLVKALELLGEKGKSIDHALLWEAAVPNNVFNRPEPKNGKKDIWYLPSLVDGADKFTILHSYNDNILGKLPETTASGMQADGVKQSDVDRAKPFMAELLPAYIISYAGLGSVYHFATWAGVPLGGLLDYNLQQKIYHRLLTTIDDKYLAPANLTDAQKRKQVSKRKQCLLPTLDEQLRYDMLGSEHEYMQIDKNLQDNMPVIIKAFKDAGWDSADKMQQLLRHAELGMGGKLLDCPELLLNLTKAATVYLQMKEKEPIEIIPESYGATGNDDIDTAFGSPLVLIAPSLQGLFCLIRVVQKVKQQPVPALGYQGLPKDFATANASKFIDVPQHKWLWSHSGMHVPSSDVMSNIYHGVILDTSKGLQKFGNY